jgi:GTP-binding protein
LPGYGYAKVSKIKREELYNLIENYLINRLNLKQVFVLIDCKVGIKDSDIDILDLISENNKRFSIILTKVDKCASNYIDKQKKSLLSLLQNYKLHFNNIFSSSSAKNIGIVDIQKEIFNLTKII